VIELACQRGASVAAVALANGLNAKLLRRWVREAQQAAGKPRIAAREAATSLPTFVPVALSDDGPRAATVAQALPAPLPGSVKLEIRRGATTVHASLPLDERSAAWLHEVLG
jgi:hypothetical protein